MLKEYFKNTDRNDAIITALVDGYTQASIAKFRGISRSLVCKIVRVVSRYSTHSTTYLGEGKYPNKEDFLKLGAKHKMQ